MSMGRGTAIAGAVAALSLSGCGNEGDEQTERPMAIPFERTVTISDDRYRPARVRILVGGHVTWINRDGRSVHTAQTDISYDPKQPWTENTDFDTHTLTWGEPYTVTFNKPGAYEYYCSFHEMKGIVEVTTRSPPSTQP